MTTPTDVMKEKRVWGRDFGNVQKKKNILGIIDSGII